MEHGVGWLDRQKESLGDFYFPLLGLVPPICAYALHVPCRVLQTEWTSWQCSPPGPLNRQFPTLEVGCT